MPLICPTCQILWGGLTAVPLLKRAANEYRRPASIPFSTGSSAGSVDLPAIASDTDTHAHTRRPEADAGTRTVVPIVVAAALDVALARRIIVGIPDDHAAAAAGPITAPILIADQANRLHHRKVRIRVFAGGVDISG